MIALLICYHFTGMRVCSIERRFSSFNWCPRKPLSFPSPRPVFFNKQWVGWPSHPSSLIVDRPSRTHTGLTAAHCSIIIGLAEPSGSQFLRTFDVWPALLRRCPVYVCGSLESLQQPLRPLRRLAVLLPPSAFEPLPSILHHLCRKLYPRERPSGIR